MGGGVTTTVASARLEVPEYRPSRPGRLWGERLDVAPRLIHDEYTALFALNGDVPCFDDVDSVTRAELAEELGEAFGNGTVFHERSLEPWCLELLAAEGMGPAEVFESFFAAISSAIAGSDNVTAWKILDAISAGEWYQLVMNPTLRRTLHQHRLVFVPAEPRRSALCPPAWDEPLGPLMLLDLFRDPRMEWALTEGVVTNARRLLGDPDRRPWLATIAQQVNDAVDAVVTDEAPITTAGIQEIRRLFEVCGNRPIASFHSLLTRGAVHALRIVSGFTTWPLPRSSEIVDVLNALQPGPFSPQVHQLVSSAMALEQLCARKSIEPRDVLLAVAMLCGTLSAGDAMAWLTPLTAALYDYDA